MQVGDTEVLTAQVDPDDATDKTLVWSSSDNTVVTVNNGSVSAVKEGSAIITVKAGDKSASCTVTVEKRFIPVESVTLSADSLVMLAGEKEQITATVAPEDATDPTVVWESSNMAVATVDGGLVSALSKGEVTIRANVGDCSAECRISVIDEDERLVVGNIQNDSPIIHFEGGADVVLVSGPKEK